MIKVLEIYLKNPKNIDKIKIIVEKIFNESYVNTWADSNSALFSALKG